MIGVRPALDGSGVRFGALPPLSLYVHVPWCVSKCPYCDFNSHALRGSLPGERYARALISDLEQSLPLISGRTVDTVFLGGGTPSLLPPEAVETIFTGLRTRVALAVNAEITLEANPGSSEAARFAAYAQLGVNRLSIGIQSFNPAHLRALGRVHDDGQARHALELARACFDNFNLDLMYGLPGQTPDEAVEDVESALGYQPAHVSAYHLTLEPNTWFFNHPPPLPDEDACCAMQAGIESLLAASGYEHYEISAFARPGFRSRHNLNYWQFGDYLGIGAGAHSKLSFPDRILRQVRFKHPEIYMTRTEAAAQPVQEESEVALRDVGFEFMMNALRMTEGFPVGLFAQHAGAPLALVERELALAAARGLLRRDQQRIAPTQLGRRFLNDLLQLFLRETYGSAGDQQRASAA
jgi:putative oxygen-independent coproporphyrinogen III oxidase